MIYQRLSKRQRLAMLWWNQPKFKDREALIADGSIRSGKTVCMTVGFILWSMSTFEDQLFAICGKTVGSLRRNIVLNLRSWLPEEFNIEEKRGENMLIITDCTGKKNTYFLFGGKDEGSYMLIQGITLAGALLDEVALMPQSFVDQACARCSVAGSKLWFNCNPAGPEHWFYKEWVLKAKEKNALHLHFTMEDNNAIAPEIKARYERMYSGVFYRRYILGLWCIAEGLVYDFFDRAVNVTSEIPEKGEYYISIDYGTMNPFSAGLWSLNGDKAVRISEYYYNGRAKSVQLTDEEYCDAVEKLAESRPKVFDEETGEDITPKIKKVVVDPSAASFITALRKRGFTVIKADNDVIDGIRRTAVYLKAGNILIGEACDDAIREFGVYCWDDKEKGEDKVVKENDHAMDDIRYFSNTIMRHKVGKKEYKSIL